MVAAGGRDAGFLLGVRFCRGRRQYARGRKASRWCQGRDDINPIPFSNQLCPRGGLRPLGREPAWRGWPWDGAFMAVKPLFGLGVHGLRGKSVMTWE